MIMSSKMFMKQLSYTITVEGQNLVIEFFVTFSRFECALKASGYAIGDIEKVNPNWDLFTASIREAFDNEVRPESVRSAIEYFSNKSPRVQNYENGQLGWRQRAFQPNEPLINRLSHSI